MTRRWTPLDYKTASSIYKRQAVKFGAFKLKLHEKQPKAPLSPIYITLRLPPDGPLTEEDIELIGQTIYNMVLREDVKFGLVAGIPRAGVPIAKVVARLSGKPLVELIKKNEGDRRKIDSIEGEYPAGLCVLIIDDLITKVDTKKEAIDVCERAGLVIAALAVLIDREQGGSDELKREGYELLAVFPLSKLLEYYVEAGLLISEKRDEVMAYIRS